MFTLMASRCDSSAVASAEPEISVFTLMANRCGSSSFASAEPEISIFTLMANRCDSSAVASAETEISMFTLMANRCDAFAFPCAEPEISMFTLMAEDEFIVLACDGLWDVLPSQRAVEIARQCLQLNNNDPQICAQLLVSAAPWPATLLLGSSIQPRGVIFTQLPLACGGLLNCNLVPWQLYPAKSFRFHSPATCLGGFLNCNLVPWQLYPANRGHFHSAGVCFGGYFEK